MNDVCMHKMIRMERSLWLWLQSYLSGFVIRSVISLFEWKNGYPWDFDNWKNGEGSTEEQDCAALQRSKLQTNEEI